VIGVVSAVGEEPADRSGKIEKIGGDSDVVDVAGRQ